MITDWSMVEKLSQGFNFFFQILNVIIKSQLSKSTYLCILMMSTRILDVHRTSSSVQGETRLDSLFLTTLTRPRRREYLFYDHVTTGRTTD